jgi:hypothetical protein
MWNSWSHSNEQLFDGTKKIHVHKRKPSRIQSDRGEQSSAAFKQVGELGILTGSSGRLAGKE